MPRSTSIFRFGQQARKLFIDNILNRVTTTYSAELRNQATKKLFYGDSRPFFALIGVSLASGAGVLTKEDELEGVCWEIREAANRIQSSYNYDEITETLDDSFSLERLSIGPAIAKGCAAVVYAAALNDNDSLGAKINDLPAGDMVSSSSMAQQPLQQQSYRPELMSPLQNMSRFVHNFGGSVDNVQLFSQTSAATQFEQAMRTQNRVPHQAEERSAHFKPSETVASFSGVSSGINGLVS